MNLLCDDEFTFGCVMEDRSTVDVHATVERKNENGNLPKDRHTSLPLRLANYVSYIIL
jgi:hypothetical protein